MALIEEMDAVYKQHLRQATHQRCDICGAGDTDDRHKVSDVVHGYKHREHASPRLCYNHACGWRLSYFNLENKRKSMLAGVRRTEGPPESRIRARIVIANTVFEEQVLSDEEIDLHFTQYLANQLRKFSQKGKANDTPSN